MSQSPFQNLPPEAAEDEVPLSPVRRLQSPAERFRAGEMARETDDKASARLSSSQPAGLKARDPDGGADSELEPPSLVEAPDPFARFSGERPQLRRGAQARRTRRRLKAHTPHHHEKKPHAVAHKPIKPGAQSEPASDWDRAAQNSMARAALARKRGRVRRIVGRLVLAAGVLLTLWGGVTALTAPQFSVSRVEISGTQRTPTQQVQSLANQLVGQNVFRATIGRTQQQIEAIPTIANVEIERAWSWPPHIKVGITERRPLLQVGAGTNWWVADAQGVAFRRANQSDSHLDRLTSPQLRPVIGKTLPAAPWKRARQLEEALAADNALVVREKGDSKRGKFWDLRRVYLDENSAASLRISAQGSLAQHGETLVRLGEEGWADKLKQARVALAFFERTGRRASELDLVSGKHPRWRAKDESSSQAIE